MANRSESIPDYYDSVSMHNGPQPEKIPDRFKGMRSDRSMHHMIRYYGEQELGKCNTLQESEEGEHPTKWDQPTNFVGEFPGCGKPTGRMWLSRKGALEASKDAVESYYDFDPKKRDAFLKDKFNESWKHFDVLNEGHIEIEKASTFLKYILGNTEISFGI